MSEFAERRGERGGTFVARLAKAALLALIAIYRWTISPVAGYASEAIDRNGAWKGSWLALARLCRCHPWGSHGYDPVPDLGDEHHKLAPWRYGMWRLPRDTETKSS